MMQQNRQQKKKPYRARGSRGGRRKKASHNVQHKHQFNTVVSNEDPHTTTTKYNEINHYPVYMPMPIYISNEQFAHDHNNRVMYGTSRSHMEVQQYHPTPNYSTPANYVFKQNVQTDYSSLPPPLPLVQTSSSFSSQSSSSSVNNESFNSEMYPSAQYVNNLDESQGMYKNHTQRPIAFERNGISREISKLSKIDTSQDYWPSLFSISPRSFLMGRR